MMFEKQSFLCTYVQWTAHNFSLKNFNRTDTKSLLSIIIKIIFSEIDHIMYLSMLTAKFTEIID